MLSSTAEHRTIPPTQASQAMSGDIQSQSLREDYDYSTYMFDKISAVLLVVNIIDWFAFMRSFMYFYDQKDWLGVVYYVPSHLLLLLVVHCPMQKQIKFSKFYYRILTLFAFGMVPTIVHLMFLRHLRTIRKANSCNKNIDSIDNQVNDIFSFFTEPHLARDRLSIANISTYYIVCAKIRIITLYYAASLWFQYHSFIVLAEEMPYTFIIRVFVALINISIAMTCRNIKAIESFEIYSFFAQFLTAVASCATLMLIVFYLIITGIIQQNVESSGSDTIRYDNYSYDNFTHDVYYNYSYDINNSSILSSNVSINNVSINSEVPNMVLKSMLLFVQMYLYPNIPMLFVVYAFIAVSERKSPATVFDHNHVAALCTNFNIRNIPKAMAQIFLWVLGCICLAIAGPFMLIVCDMKSVDIVTSLLYHNINGFILGKYKSVYGQSHRQEYSSHTFFDFINWLCKYLNENQTSDVITVERKLVAAMYEICTFGHSGCDQYTVGSIPPHICIECGNDQNEETLQTNNSTGTNDSTAAVTMSQTDTMSNENSSDNINGAHDKLLSEFGGSKEFIMRLRNSIEKYELNYSFNTTKRLMLCSTSKWSEFRMLLRALYQSQTLDLVLKFTGVNDEEADFNDVTIGGFRILIPFIMLSKINWLLLPFYVLFIDCFYNYELEDIDNDLNNSNMLDAKFFYTFYFFIKIWCLVIIGTYAIILYINMKHLIPLYSRLFYLFSDKCCHDFISANGANSARDHDHEINDDLQIEVTNKANQSVIFAYLRHVFLQFTKIHGNDDMTTDIHKYPERWIVSRLSKSVRMHAESLQSRPYIAVILLEYIDDPNIVRIVFEYYPVHHF